MKTLFTLAFFIFINCGLAQTYTWAITDTLNSSTGLSIHKDSFGNLYVVERLNNNLTKGYRLIKYDANRIITWAQFIKGNKITDGAIVSDNFGNVYFAGTFKDSISVTNGFGYFAGDSPALILIKFNSQGIFQWAKRTFGICVTGLKITCDINDKIYVAGNITGNNNFDTININIPGGGCNYIAKYNGAGVIQWIRKTGTGNGAYWGLGFETDKHGNSYLAGTFNSQETFGTYSVTAYGGAYFQEAYLAKIDSSGNWLWAKHIGGGIGGSEQAGLYDLTLDTMGNPYVCGFTGYINTTFGAVTITNTGEDDWFLAKYDPSGNCEWAKCGGGPGSQFATGVCVDNNQNVYLARSGCFFAKFDGTGNYLFSHVKPAQNIEMINDGEGGLYFIGVHYGPVVFDNYNLNITAGNGNQMFIAKLNEAALTTHLKNEEENFTFAIYPNPAKNSITLATLEPLKNSILKIINSSGQIVHQQEFKDGHTSTVDINVSYLTEGVYLIQIIEQSGKYMIQAKKVIIQ